MIQMLKFSEKGMTRTQTGLFRKNDLKTNSEAAL